MKCSLRSFRVLVMLVMMSIVLGGCVAHKQENMPVKEEVIAEGGSEPVDVSLNYMPTEERKTVETDIGYTWTVDSSDSLIKSGTIEYTLDQVYICQTIDDLPIAEEKCFEPYEAYFADYQDDRLILQRFPDFVEADGSFCNNGRIVICDIKAHNIDAIPNAVGGGKYSEDYLFRADNILILVDTKEEKQGLAEGKVYLPTYFDKGSAYPDHMMLFKLLPGETETISIGFLISGTREGEGQDISTFKGNIILKQKTISLNLGL